MIFQTIYDAIKNWQVPKWIKEIMSQLNVLMMAILRTAGQSYIIYLETTIIEAAQNKNLSSEQKFQWVFKQAKQGFKIYSVEFKDNVLGTLINYLVSQLKKDNII